jgi:hypothetical protein
MSFLLTFAASTGVTTDPGPAGATYSFISAVPGGVTVARSGGAMHLNTSGFVILDPANLGRIDCDALLDGAPPGSISRELTGVSAFSTDIDVAVGTTRTLVAVPASAVAGVAVPAIITVTNATVSLPSGAATGITGTPGIGSVTLSGRTATGAAGNTTVVTTGSASLSGNAATGVPGIPVPAPISSAATTLTATIATGSTGTLVFSTQPAALSSTALVGSSAAFGIVLVPAALSSVPATGAVGSGTVSTTGFATITGNAGTGAAGIPIPISSTGSTLTGTQAVGGAGFLSDSSSPPVFSSVALTGSAGSFGIAMTPAVLAGLLAAGSGGVLLASAIKLSSALGFGGVGIMTEGVAKTLPAAVATGSAGSLIRPSRPFSSGFSSGFG